MMKMNNKIREITGQVSQSMWSIRGPVCLFFVAEYDPDYLSASCYHTYTPVTKADV